MRKIDLEKYQSYFIVNTLYFIYFYFVFSSRSKSKGKHVSNGHGSPTVKEKSPSSSPKNDITLNEEKTANIKVS